MTICPNTGLECGPLQHVERINAQIGTDLSYLTGAAAVELCQRNIVDAKHAGDENPYRICGLGVDLEYVEHLVTDEGAVQQMIVSEGVSHAS